MSSCTFAVPVVDNKDLQTYLKIEEDNDSLTAPSPEAVEVLDRASVACEDVGEIDEVDEEDTYYVDGAGNYHFQPLFSSLKDVLAVSSEAPEELKKNAPATSKKRTTPLKTHRILRQSGRKRKVARVEETKEKENNEKPDNDPGAVGGDDKTSTSAASSGAKCSAAQDPNDCNGAVKTHSDDDPFKCTMCERSFKTNTWLQKHVRSRHIGEKTHKCYECEYSTFDLSKLRRHIRWHTGERPYQCPHCIHAAIDNSKLQRHMRTHTGERPYACDICQARFTQSSTLKVHRHIHSGGKKPVFQCTLCPTTCSRKTELRLHIQTLHHSEKPITCQRCGKDWPDRYSYKVHMKSHLGEKCYRCQFCTYACTSMHHLKSHMDIHNEEKPFACQHCKQSFRRYQQLKRHINRYHSEDYKPPKPCAKLHSCTDCKRSFTHKGNLMRHMKQHDPEANTQPEKVKLKMGRLTRMETGGSIATVATDKSRLRPAQIDYDEMNDEAEVKTEDDSNELFSEKDNEVIEVVNEIKEEEEVDQKPLTTSVKPTIITKAEANQLLLCVPQLTTVSIKKEPDGTEFMAMEVNYDQEFIAIVNTNITRKVHFTRSTL